MNLHRLRRLKYLAAGAALVGAAVFADKAPPRPAEPIRLNSPPRKPPQPEKTDGGAPDGGASAASPKAQ